MTKPPRFIRLRAWVMSNYLMQEIDAYRRDRRNPWVIVTRREQVAQFFEPVTLRLTGRCRQCRLPKYSHKMDCSYR